MVISDQYVMRRVVEEILRTPGATALLSELNRFPPGPLLSMVEKEAVSMSERDIDPAWLAAVYGFLLERLSPLPREAETDVAIEDEARYIGAVFRERLVPGLSEECLNLGAFFKPSLRMDEESYAHCLRDPSVRMGGVVARELAEYGLTPVLVLEAGSAIGRLLRRIQRRRGEPAAHYLHIGAFDSPGDLPGVVPVADLCNAIALNLSIPKDLAASLTRWLLRVSMERPYVFTGFYVIPERPDRILVLPVPGRPKSPEFLWEPRIGNVEAYQPAPAPRTHAGGLEGAERSGRGASS